MSHPPLELRVVTFEVTGEVGLLTLNRPKTINVLDLQMSADLTEVILHIHQNPDHSALAIPGSGEAFCADIDLKSLNETRRPVAVTRTRVQELHLWFRELVDLELPVIVAVDGPACCAGLNPALTTDFIFVSPRAWFCAVFGSNGPVPYLGGFFCCLASSGCR